MIAAFWSYEYSRRIRHGLNFENFKNLEDLEILKNLVSTYFEYFENCLVALGALY